MDRPTHPVTEPVFWWWQEAAGARVVVLTDSLLVLSGPLTREGLLDLEQARSDGDVLSADFGPRVLRVPLGAVTNLRYVPDDVRVLVDLDDGRTTCAIEPPRESAGVAAGVFDVLAKRLAPESEARDTGAAHRVLDFASEWVVHLMAAIGGVGILFLGLAAWASDDASRSAATGPINTVFATLGYGPAGLCFVAVLALQIMRMLGYDGAKSNGANPRVLEVSTDGSARADNTSGLDLFDDTAGDEGHAVAGAQPDPLADLLIPESAEDGAIAMAPVAEPVASPEPLTPPVPVAERVASPEPLTATVPDAAADPEPVVHSDPVPVPEAEPEQVTEPAPVVVEDPNAPKPAWATSS